jgi:hypothetical protein
MQHTSQKDTINAGGPRSLYSIPSVPRISLFLIPHSAQDPSFAAAAPVLLPPAIEPLRSPMTHPLDVGQPITSAAYSTRLRRPASKTSAQCWPSPPGARSSCSWAPPCLLRSTPHPPDLVDLGSRCPSFAFLPASMHRSWATAQDAVVSSNGGPSPRRPEHRPHPSTVSSW